MCLKESRWRRFTADSVTEITIVQSGIKMAARFLKNSASTTARYRELGVFFWLQAASFTYRCRVAWQFLSSFQPNRLSEPLKIVNVSSPNTRLNGSGLQIHGAL